jgi:hypothetical protein
MMQLVALESQKRPGSGGNAQDQCRHAVAKVWWIHILHSVQSTVSGHSWSQWLGKAILQILHRILAGATYEDTARVVKGCWLKILYDILHYCNQKAMTNNFIWCHHILRNTKTMHKSSHTTLEKYSDVTSTVEQLSLKIFLDIPRRRRGWIIENLWKYHQNG